MVKKALITGISGQDGAWLSKFLLEKGYEVYGTYRRLSTPNFWRLLYLEVYDRVKLIPADLIDMASMMEALEISQPDEIYHLAAQSFVGASFEQPISTSEITGLGTLRILEAIKRINQKIKFYNAETSELYGNSEWMLQNETSPFQPVSPYAIAKLMGYWYTRMYREAHGIFACNGILFNHESHLRGMEFVTRKISNSVAKIEVGLENELILGNLEARRDWGYAPDFCMAMWLMMQQNKPDDYCIATGESHSVMEFVELAFSIVGKDWNKYVKTSDNFKRSLDVNYLRGDATKARKELGWNSKVTFNELVEIMVNSDLNNWQRYLRGEHFPWDAPNYPSEANIITRNLKI